MNMKIEDVIEACKSIAKGEKPASSYEFDYTELGSWLEELIRLRKLNEATPEERQVFEKLDEISNDYLNELSWLQEYSIEEIEGMNYDGDDSEGDRLYREAGDYLFGEKEPEYIREEFDELAKFIKNNAIYLELPDGVKTQDPREYLFHEYKNKEFDDQFHLKWLGIDAKFEVFRKKIIEFGW